MEHWYQFPEWFHNLFIQWLVSQDWLVYVGQWLLFIFCILAIVGITIKLGGFLIMIILLIFDK